MNNNTRNSQAWKRHGDEKMSVKFNVSCQSEVTQTQMKLSLCIPPLSIILSANLSSDCSRRADRRAPAEELRPRRETVIRWPVQTVWLWGDSANDSTVLLKSSENNPQLQCSFLQVKWGCKAAPLHPPGSNGKCHIICCWSPPTECTSASQTKTSLFQVAENKGDKAAIDTWPWGLKILAVAWSEYKKTKQRVITKSLAFVKVTLTFASLETS